MCVMATYYLFSRILAATRELNRYAHQITWLNQSILVGMLMGLLVTLLLVVLMGRLLLKLMSIILVPQPHFVL